MTTRRRVRGFTLLEIAVSLAILGVGMVACMQAFGAGLRLKGQVEREDRAVDLASKELDRLILENPSGSGSVERGEYRVRWSTRDADERDGFEPNPDIDFDMRYLEVEVAWGGGVGENSYTVRTLQIVPKRD